MVSWFFFAVLSQVEKMPIFDMMKFIRYALAIRLFALFMSVVHSVCFHLNRIIDIRMGGLVTHLSPMYLKSNAKGKKQIQKSNMSIRYASQEIL